MSKVKSYKDQETAEQSVNEPMMAYNQEIIAQRIYVEVPPSDVAFFKELVKKWGGMWYWVITCLTKRIKYQDILL